MKKQPKFKVGDKLRVFRLSPYDDKGSEPCDNFVVRSVEGPYDDKGYVYFPKNGGQGAYEIQLAPNTISSWKDRLQC